MIHSYNKLAHPLSQVVAASRFCVGILAYFQDEYEGDDADQDLTPWTVLDVLARLGLRFEIDGQEEGEGVWSRGTDPYIEDFLDAYVELVADDFDANGILEYDEDNGVNMTSLITLHGCILDNLIFVPDLEGVTRIACFMSLSPDHLPTRHDP